MSFSPNDSLRLAESLPDDGATKLYQDLDVDERQSVLSILQGIDRNSAVRADNTKKRVEEEMAEDKMPQKKKRG